MIQEYNLLGDKMKLKHIARTVTLLLFVALAIHICYKALSWKDTTGGYLSAYEQLYNTPDNTIDVLFVGTSHVYCGIYPSILWREYGISSFDMSVAGQDKMSAYYGTKEVLKKQRPQVVMVDLYSLCYEDQPVLANEYRNLLGMKYSLNFINLVENYNASFYHNKKDYYLRFPIIHTRYRELQRYDFVECPQSVYGKGEDIYFINRDGYDGSFTELQNCTRKVPLSDEESEWLENWKELASHNGFNIIFILMPADIPENLQEKMSAIEDWTRENNIKFYNLNEKRNEIGVASGDNFLDKDHLNAFGAEKVTKYIYEKVLFDYALANHKLDKRYESWDKDLRRLEHEQAIRNMDTVNSAQDYLSIATKTEGITFVLGLKGNKENAALFSDLTTACGLDSSEVEKGGLWICKNGETTRVEEEALNNGKIVKMGQYEFSKLYKDSSLDYHICLNGMDYCIQNNGLLVLAYDEFLERELQKRDF